MSQRILNIAHRGARSLAPENTLAAARKALKLEADLWEFDVQMTRDGELILMHDDTLSQTTNAEEVFPDGWPWSVTDFTLEQIRRLDAGSWFVRTDPFGEITAGHVSKSQQRNYIGEPIPPLWEALQFTQAHNWRANIEIKQVSASTPSLAERRSAELLRKLVDLVVELDMEEDVIVSSFDHLLIWEIKELNPKLTGAVLVLEPLLDPLGHLETIGADAYHPSLLAFDPEVARKLCQAGYSVNIWTVNDPKMMKALVNEPGITGIFTDYPQRLEPILGP